MKVLNNEEIKDLLMELVPKWKRAKFERIWNLLGRDDATLLMTTEEQYISDMQDFWSALEDSAASVIGIQAQELYKVTRKQEVVLTRQIIFWYLRNCTQLTLANIGAHYNKDHATILHGITRVAGQLEVDKFFYSTVWKVADLMEQKGYSKPMQFISIFEKELEQLRLKKLKKLRR